MSMLIYDPTTKTLKSLSADLSMTGTSKEILTASTEFSAQKVYNAVWNDIADAVEVPEDLILEAGKCYAYDGSSYHKTTEKGELGALGIHSDTAGYILGLDTKAHQLILAIGGFVLAHVDNIYPSGTPLICTKDGILTVAEPEFLKEHPDRIIAHFYKEETKTEYENLKVNGRHWVKVR